MTNDHLRGSGAAQGWSRIGCGRLRRGHSRRCPRGRVRGRLSVHSEKLACLIAWNERWHAAVGHEYDTTFYRRLLDKGRTVAIASGLSLSTGASFRGGEDVVILPHETGAAREVPASGLKIRGKHARKRENDRKQFGRYPYTGFCVQMANWTEGELAELGYALRQYIEAGVSRGKTCSSCGGRFRQRRGRRSKLYPTCRPAGRRRVERDRLARRRPRQPTAGKRICEACGRPYQAARRWSKYCGPDAGISASQVRHASERRGITGAGLRRARLHTYDKTRDDPPSWASCAAASHPRHCGASGEVHSGDTGLPVTSEPKRSGIPSLDLKE
jgi:hypothetical protein